MFANEEEAKQIIALFNSANVKTPLFFLYYYHNIIMKFIYVCE